MPLHEVSGMVREVRSGWSRGAQEGTSGKLRRLCYGFMKVWERHLSAIAKTVAMHKVWHSHTVEHKTEKGMGIYKILLGKEVRHNRAQMTEIHLYKGKPDPCSLAVRILATFWGEVTGRAEVLVRFQSLIWDAGACVSQLVKFICISTGCFGVFFKKQRYGSTEDFSSQGMV